MEGISPSAPSGHQIRQTEPCPPGGCRFLVHFEGWTEKWDEYIVLPSQAKRFKPNMNRGAQRRMGRRTDDTCRIGPVAGLMIRGPGGETREATVIGMGTPPNMPTRPSPSWDHGPTTAEWSDVGLHFLLRYENGQQEWIDIADRESRSRIETYRRPYTQPCACQECRDLTNAAEDDEQTDGAGTAGLDAQLNEVPIQAYEVPIHLAY
mmetsp:Transcript_3564/g.5662  ORF Transcript_3564/g.5662 Transcript_3564/m.5662 type:complete len:207 (+) Transcript_3564:762-1382(+)